MRVEPITEVDMIQKADSSAELQQEEVYRNNEVPFGRRLKRFFRHFAARQLMHLCLIAIKIAGLLGRRKKRLLPGQGCEIMLTGRFDSANWILAHLGPLAASKECSRIWIISTDSVPEIPKVKTIHPHKWIIKVIGTTPARLLTLLWAAIRKRPHIIGGFHVMPNGMAAALVGRITGARSVYFSVGGPLEIEGGGVYSETVFFRKMETPDDIVEKRLLEVISSLDTIVTMGTKAVEFFKRKGINIEFQILSGGLDPEKFRPSDEKHSVDLILTSRLEEIKRIDIFLQAVRLVADKIPQVKTLVVGDGKLLDELKRIACNLGIKNNVDFTGYQNNIESWLQKSKLFVLTSDSEGLSLSMIEAMMCGLPAIVSNVGDLGDLVEDEVNGFLVPRRCPKQFAARIIELLTNEGKLRTFSRAARNAALKYSISTATEKWNNIIEKCRCS